MPAIIITKRKWVIHQDR